MRGVLYGSSPVMRWYFEEVAVAQMVSHLPIDGVTKVEVNAAG